MKMLATPLRSVFARVAVENSKVPLTTNGTEISDERVRVLHCSALAFIIVDTYLVC